jgi:cell division protein FtsN
MAHLMFRARRGAAWQTALGLAALGTVAALTGAFLVGPMLKVKPPKAAARIANARPSINGAPMDEDSGDEQTPPRARPSARARQDGDDATDAKQRSEEPARKKATRELAQAKADADATDDDSGTAPGPRSRRRYDDSTAEGSDAGSGKSPREARTNARAVDASNDTSATQAKPEVSLREVGRHPRVENPHAVAGMRSSDSEAGGDEDKESGSSASLYRVRVGRYASREKADEVRARLTANGIPASVVQRGTGYTVQAGSYRVKENAERVADSLRQQDLHPEVSYR